MNKKLTAKLAKKATEAVIITDNSANAFQAGQKVFAAMKGSYGLTINPFNRKQQHTAHRDFRMGFMHGRDESKGIVRGLKGPTPGAFGLTQARN